MTGVPGKYYHYEIENYNRYAHSVGVTLLLKKLGASLEEQIAGLIHDVSHLAFAHVADWVFAQGSKANEDFAESLMHEFVENTQIGDMLRKHGFTTAEILDKERFRLLDTSIPDICADRVDYSLREFALETDPSVTAGTLMNITNFKGEMVFTSQNAAYVFATNFLDLQQKRWGSYEAVVRYHLFAQALKRAIEKGIIEKNDFYKDEDTILTKVEIAGDAGIDSIFAQLREKPLKHIVNGTERIYKKFRYVDPKILLNNNLVRLSSLDEGYKNLVDERRKLNQAGLLV